MFNKSMSEHDGLPKYKDEEVFLELIDASESRDVGIALYEQEMRELASSLTSSYAGKRNIEDDILSIDEELDDRWMYHGRIATVSGRVYLTEPGLRHVLPAEWGEPEEDENGDEFFYLDDVKLRSHGIEVVPLYDPDPEDGAVYEVKVGYLFSSEDDSMENPILTVYPGELSKHEYKNPTAAEAEVRLARYWPQQFAVMSKLLKIDAPAQTPGRLIALRRRLQVILRESAQFRALAEIYANDALRLDPTMPFTLTGNKEVYVYEGDDPSDPDQEGEWSALKVEEPLTLLAYTPVVRFIDRGDGTIGANIISQVYNQEDGEEPEYVSIAAENITQMRSNRLVRSLLSRALMITDDATFVVHTEPDEINPPAEEDAESVITIALPEKGHSRLPLRIQEMELIESELEAIAKEVRQHAKVVYSNQEAAFKATKELIDTHLNSRIAGAGLKEGYRLEFFGEHAIRPRVERRLPDTSNLPHISVFGIDATDPYVPLEKGDSFIGLFNSLQPRTYEMRAEDGSVVGYRVYPSMVATFSQTSQSLYTTEGTSLVDQVRAMRATIPLNGTGGIKIRALEEFRAVNTEMKKVADTYGRHPVAHRLRRLREAVYRAESSESVEFTPLNAIHLLRSLEKNVQELRRDGLPTAVATDALERMFMGKPVQVEGDVFGLRDKSGGKYELVEDEKLLTGTIADVRRDVNGEEVSFAILTETGNLGYMPISKITSLNF